MAEGLLRRRVADSGVTVRSAGLLRDGRPASPHGVAALASRGIDIADHRSRHMTGELLRQADLVVGMAREHVREAVVLAPEVWPRAFTLKELVRRGEAVGPRAAGEPLDDWLSRVAGGRERRGLLGDDPADDVEDPIGRPADAYERTATELEDLVERLVALVWAEAREGAPR